MVGQQTHQAYTRHEGHHQNARAGELRHAHQCLSRKLSLPAGNQVAKEREPEETPQGNPAQTRGFALPGVVHPVVRDKGGGNRDPEKQHTRVAKAADKTGPERRVRMQAMLEGDAG